MAGTCRVPAVLGRHPIFHFSMTARSISLPRLSPSLIHAQLTSSLSQAHVLLCFLESSSSMSVFGDLQPAHARMRKWTLKHETRCSDDSVVLMARPLFRQVATQNATLTR